MTEVIAPEAVYRRWEQEHTWHLDLVPLLIEVLVDAALPSVPVSRGGSRFDRDQITGGGHVDNMAALDHFDIDGGVLQPGGAAAEARELWAWLTGYASACSAWLNQAVTAPYAADLPPVVARVNADPLTSCGEALVIVGWLIDRAHRIVDYPELNEHRDEMFRLIRHLRGRYGVFPNPRRARPAMCRLCGTPDAVHTTWATSKDGRARAVEVKTCKVCGDTSREDEGETR